MAQLAIRGHATRGKEVIEILEMLGGNNRGCRLSGKTKYYYYIGTFNFINYTIKEKLNDSFIIFTLEEFSEKFPYKIGDRVRVPEYESEVYISKMYWDGNEVQYEVVTDEVEWYSAEELNEFNEPTKKEIVEDIIKIDIPKGYEFDSVDNQQVVFKKVKLKYPKTYVECAKLLDCFGAAHIDGYKSELLDKFQELLICRDAYWKITGEQMGLDEPWEPDWSDDCIKYIITVAENKIYTDVSYIFNYILVFPTEEIRDIFYKNFKDLIEKCKEFL